MPTGKKMTAFGSSDAARLNADTQRQSAAKQQQISASRRPIAKGAVRP
jgi:hypothetical protein